MSGSLQQSETQLGVSLMDLVLPDHRPEPDILIKYV